MKCAYDPKLLILATAIIFGTISCAKENEEYQYDGPGTYDVKIGEVVFRGKSSPPISLISPPQLTPEERAQFCSIYVPQEQDPEVRWSFLQSLAGKWQREISENSNVLGGPFGMIFEFSLADLKASLSGGFLTGGEDIIADRVCLSRELYRGDAYDKFRIVEFKAANNEGVAVLGVRFASPQLKHDYPVLWLSERQYFRYGSTQPVKSEDSAFTASHSNETSARLWIYPTRL